jgi:hypothetical protein
MHYFSALKEGSTGLEEDRAVARTSEGYRLERRIPGSGRMHIKYRWNTASKFHLLLVPRRLRTDNQPATSVMRSTRSLQRKYATLSTFASCGERLRQRREGEADLLDNLLASGCELLLPTLST